MEIRVKEFVDSFTNYLFVLKSAQNGGNYVKFDVKKVHLLNEQGGYEEAYAIDFNVISSVVKVEKIMDHSVEESLSQEDIELIALVTMAEAERESEFGKRHQSLS